MSFITGGASELLYASLNAGTAAAASAETQINDTTLIIPQARLEPDFWLPNQNQTGKAIHITARGLMTTGTVIPNLTLSIRLGVAGVTGPIALATPATIMRASITNGFWHFEGDIIVKTMGAAGGNSTVQGYGALMTIASASSYETSMTGTAATLDTSITNYINVTALMSTTGNTITLQQLLVYGLN